MESGRLSNGKTGGEHREFTQSDIRELAAVSRGLPIEGRTEFTSSAGSTSIERAVRTQNFLRGKSSQVQWKLLDRISLFSSQCLKIIKSYGWDNTF